MKHEASYVLYFQAVMEPYFRT